MKQLNFFFAGLVLIFLASCKSLDAPEPTGTCSDSILNQDETQVDCGGVCTACPTCVDGIQNQGELGIDCGGPCTLTCYATPPCSTAVNTLDPNGLSNMAFLTYYHHLDVDGNHVYGASNSSGAGRVDLTFSKSYNFSASGMFDLTTDPYPSTMYGLTIRVETASQVYHLYSTDAYVQISGGMLSVIVCNATMGNSMLSTTADGNFYFPAIH